MSKTPKVDRAEFTAVVGNLLKQQPMRRDSVKIDAKKPRTLIPSRESDRPKASHPQADDKA